MKTFIRVVELWVPDRTRTRLEFGGCLCSEEYSEFKAVSENALFAYDEGLPGQAWAAGMPLIIKDLHNAKSFLRWEEASEIGINCGVGIPYTTPPDQTWVMTFLSAQATPIARRFEIWVPNPARTELVFQSGDCSKNADLTSLYASKTIRKGEGSIGGTWATGMPAINEHLKVDESITAQLARAAGMNQIVVLPVIENALLKAVLAWYL